MAKGTPQHNIRIPDERWNAAVAKAGRTGRPVVAVVNNALERWITEPDSEALDLMEAELKELREADFAHELFTETNVSRREEIIIVLAKAGRL